MKVDKKLDDNARCKYCGRTGHGRNPDAKARKKLCPAFEQSCFRCAGTRHFSNYCLEKKKAKEGDAEHSAVMVVESIHGNTEEAATFFGIRAQSEEWFLGEENSEDEEIITGDEDSEDEDTNETDPSVMMGGMLFLGEEDSEDDVDVFKWVPDVDVVSSVPNGDWGYG